jgi:hypothetical protein
MASPLIGGWTLDLRRGEMRAALADRFGPVSAVSCAE